MLGTRRLRLSGGRPRTERLVPPSSGVYVGVIEASFRGRPQWISGQDSLDRYGVIARKQDVGYLSGKERVAAGRLGNRSICSRPEFQANWVGFDSIHRKP